MRIGFRSDDELGGADGPDAALAMSSGTSRPTIVSSSESSC